LLQHWHIIGTGKNIGMKRVNERVELTTTRVKNFLNSAQIGQRLYDSKVADFYIRKMKTGGYFYLNYRTDTGKLKTVKIAKYTEKTVEQAREAAIVEAAKVVKGEDIQETRKAKKRAASKTARGYLDSKYKAVQARKRGGVRTVQIIEGFFSDLLDKPMIELCPDDVAAWQAGQEATGVKYETIKRRYGAFKTLLNHAAKSEHIKANPLQGIGLERYHETEEQKALKKSRRTYLTQKQMKAFLQSLDLYQEEKRQQRRNSRAHGKQHLPDLDKVEFVDHVKPAMLTLFYTGFRKGDVLGLRWEDVDLTFASSIRKVVEKTKEKVPDEKNFPISPPLLRVLKAWHKQQGRPNSGLVFPSPRTGGRLDPTALQAPWKSIRKLAGLSDELQLYTLRHNFASHLVMKGCDLLSVARLLGHSDIEMLVKHYGHLQPSLLKNYSAQFADITNASDSEPQDQEISA